MKKKIKKVLVIRLGAIGDVMHSTIIANAIKAKHPDCKVHFLAAKAMVPLLQNHPFIDKTFLFDFSQRENYKYILKLGLYLRKENYDVVFNLTNAFRNLILSHLISNKVVNKHSNKNFHAVEEFFYTANSIFKDLEMPEKLTLQIEDGIKQKVKEKIKNYGKKIVILNPAGQNDLARQGRIWNIQKWHDCAKIIIEKYNAHVVVTGSKLEAEYHKALLDIPYVQVLSGQLELIECAALYSLSNLVISGDSGPLHIASALDVNLISLYGSTNPLKYGPFGNLQSVITAPQNICKFCYKKSCKKLLSGQKYTPCMENILVDYVINKIESEKLL